MNRLFWFFFAFVVLAFAIGLIVGYIVGWNDANAICEDVFLGHLP